MRNRTWMNRIGLTLGASLLAFAQFAPAQPTFGNPSPTAGSQTSQKANAAADQAIYQPVAYTNANKKGPALIVLPGEIKSTNATFLQKFTANNIADFGEIELSAANFQVLERSNLGPILNEFSLAYNLGDPNAARKFLGMGKLKSTKYIVKFDVLKTEQVAAAQSGFDGRTIGAMAGLLGGLGVARRQRGHRRRRFGADERIVRRLDHRHALQDHQCRDHRAAGHRLHRGEDGGRRDVDIGDGRVPVAAGRRFPGHHGPAADPEERVGNRQQVQVTRRAGARPRRRCAAGVRGSGLRFAGTGHPPGSDAWLR